MFNEEREREREKDRETEREREHHRALCILWIEVMDWSLELELWSEILEWILGVEHWREDGITESRNDWVNPV